MQIPTEPIWVESEQTLRELCQRWSTQAAIAVDTEFMRSDTYYPIAGLIQVGDGNGCYLIDPVAIKDLSPLAELWRNENVVKVLHACSEDLEVFNVSMSALPTPLFDTQIAAAFAGYGFSLGYANLAREMLGVDIPKGETRSDWLARPLSVAQKKYAALDVAHLLIVYGKLLQALKQNNRLSWVQSDCEALINNARTPLNPSLAYEKIGMGWKLAERSVAVLQLLAQWRECEARKRDLPRNRLLKEQPLFEMARRLPDSLSQLERIDGIPKRTLLDDGEQLLDIIAQGCALPESELPARMTPPLGREYGAAMKQLKAWVKDRAEREAIPIEVLIRKKEYEQIIRAVAAGQPELPGRLNGWRAALFARDLLDVAQRQVEEVQ
ncbi:ribonuclease D [Gilvimarinus agarilyticus]|uniref:ribonuclease D n=1 Tax=unclassified Gilvimarinus TaxID=2642066 RepID=UPI001C08394B|nr:MULTISPECIES: ribonuclease D [unclassified Gilvimarinus]MBU2885941.1 ribonuclease D [Gilvimarinus agarilyticus]MDO6570687.1 ribonuclease D [Gilvimarinus sp. 2_MG-2023]MDO6747720.1 ribonuclease D [Gilvimarinus sp. 1_MG-2023]